MKTEQPLWGRGIMISPQHFQQQAAYAAWSAECIARLGLNHPWGVIESTFEPDMLKLGRLQARRLHVRFQDGSLIDTDNADALPPALSLDGESRDAVVVLALPLLRANGGNCLTPDEVADRPVRYRQRWQDVRNQYGEDTRQIAVMQPELTLRFAHQNNSDYLTCPVARLLQDSQGIWELDGSFLPPLLKDASLRLEALSALPPDWHLRYGQDLINQAYALWPGLPGTEELGAQWRQKLALNGTPDDSLAGWHQGMRRLQSLSEQLNALDGQKGRYLTVSELKSQVFAAIQAFNQSVPAEEQLRQIAARQEPGMIPQAQKLEVEQHLQQLIIRYSALTTTE